MHWRRMLKRERNVSCSWIVVRLHHRHLDAVAEHSQEVLKVSEGYLTFVEGTPQFPLRWIDGAGLLDMSRSSYNPWS